MNVTKCILTWSLVLLGTGCSTQGPHPEAEQYDAYWLTNTTLGEYVNLLISKRPIEQLVSVALSIADVSPDSLAIIVTTYKKDSIWNIDRRPFKTVTSVQNTEGEKQIFVNGTKYRYEPASLPSIVALLNAPEGSIGIHRIYAPTAGAEEFTRTLAGRLRQQVENAQQWEEGHSYRGGEGQH